MISAKMYELGTKKSTIRTIFEFGRKRAAEVGEENIFDFSLGNPNVPTPDFVVTRRLRFCKLLSRRKFTATPLRPVTPKFARRWQKVSMGVSLHISRAKTFS